LRRRFARGEITFEALEQSVNGWIAHVEHGQTWGLRNALLRSSVPPAPY
jgi:hypothetical protein